MKILIISRHFPNIIGGVSHHTLKLSIALSRMNNIYVLTSKDEKIITEIEEPSAKEKIKILKEIDKWSITGIFKQLKIIKEIKPDIIIFQYVPHMYNRLGIPCWVFFFSIAIILNRYRLITIFHEIAIRWNLKNPKEFIYALSQRILAYFLCIASKKAITSIQHYRKMLKLFDKKIVVIPIGSNIEPINITEKELRDFKEKLAPQAETIISTFGYHPKCNELIIEAIHILKQEGFKIKFVLIGDYPKEWINKIKIKIRNYDLLDAVFFTGFLKEEEIFKYLKITDIYIVIEPIKRYKEGGVSLKSTSVAAAYVAELPIIANKGDMTDNFFIHKENVYLIDSIEPEIIAEAIKLLIKNEDLKNKLKRGAKESYQTYLKWSKIEDKFYEIIGNN